MEKLRIAICDDDRTEYGQLVTILDQSGIPYEGDYYASGEDLWESCYPGKYDLYILDIYMGGMNGVELASKIRSFDGNVVISFLTTSMDHAMEGYRFHVNRYILKPFRDQEIFELVRLAYDRKVNLPAIVITANRKEHKVPFARIRYLESSKHHVNVYLTGDQVLQTGMKLAEIAAILPSPPFYQCHKSYMVNLDYVSFFNKDLNVFEIEGSGNAYIRRKSLKEAEAIYKKYMFELTRKQENE